MNALSAPPDQLSRWLLSAAEHALLGVPPSWLRGPIARFIPSEA